MTNEELFFAIILLIFLLGLNYYVLKGKKQ